MHFKVYQTALDCILFIFTVVVVTFHDILRSTCANQLDVAVDVQWNHFPNSHAQITQRELNYIISYYTMLHYITEELHLHEISSDQTLHLYMLSCASKVDFFWKIHTTDGRCAFYLDKSGSLI